MSHTGFLPDSLVSSPPPKKEKKKDRHYKILRLHKSVYFSGRLHEYFSAAEGHDISINEHGRFDVRVNPASREGLEISDANVLFASYDAQ